MFFVVDYTIRIFRRIMPWSLKGSFSGREIQPMALEFIRNLDEYKEYACGRKHWMALYRCSLCGKEVKRTRIAAPKRLSCGCYVKQIARDLTGQKIGRFQILYRVGRKRNYATWHAICLNCGEQIVVSSQQIRGDNSPCYCQLRSALVEAGRRKRVKTMRRSLELHLQGERHEED